MGSPTKAGLLARIAALGKRLRSAERAAMRARGLMMPEMDGFEFVEDFRRHEAWRHIPIVVVTSKDLTADDHQRLNGYVEKVLQKGAYTRESLLREVRDLVASSVARRRARR